MLLPWWCCSCNGRKDILSFGERCSLLCNPVLHYLRQSAVPVFAPGNLRLLLPLSPLRCAVSSVREQPGLSRCRRFLFCFFFLSTQWHRARPPEQMSEDSLPRWCGDSVGGCSPGSWCIVNAIFQCDTCTQGGSRSLWLLPLLCPSPTSPS